MTTPRRACPLCSIYGTETPPLAVRHAHTQHLLRNGQHPATIDQPGRRAA